MATNKKKRGWKWLILVMGLMAVAGLALWYFKFRGDDVPEYETAAVTRGDLMQVVTATGQLNPVTNVQVGCQISGILQKLYADYNTHVTNGQVVAQLDPATYRANLQVAEGDLANAKATLELARVNANRSKELLESKLIPQSDYDQASATLHQAQATVQVREAAVDNAKVNLERCTIYSPVDGIVISRSVDVGQTVAASLNAPTLFVIANDLTQMQIDANVAEADVGGVAVDQNVDFTVDAFPNRTFHGVVTQVRNAPITVENVVTYDTVIAVNNADLKLKPGMTANVSIIVAERDDVLRIPNAALRYHPPEAAANPTATTRAAAAGTRPAGSSGQRSRGGGGGSFGGRARGEHRSSRTVYILKNDKPEPVQIKTGITDQIYTEVTAGLNENDKVITSSMVRQTSAVSAQPNNPFGAGRRRFR
jgi:HlyD family secretion protein